MKFKDKENLLLFAINDDVENFKNIIYKYVPNFSLPNNTINNISNFFKDRKIKKSDSIFSDISDAIFMALSHNKKNILNYFFSSPLFNYLFSFKKDNHTENLAAIFIANAVITKNPEFLQKIADSNLEHKFSIFIQFLNHSIAQPDKVIFNYLISNDKIIQILKNGKHDESNNLSIVFDQICVFNNTYGFDLLLKNNLLHNPQTQSFIYHSFNSMIILDRLDFIKEIIANKIINKTPKTIEIMNLHQLEYPDTIIAINKLFDRIELKENLENQLQNSNNNKPHKINKI